MIYKNTKKILLLFFLLVVTAKAATTTDIVALDQLIKAQNTKTLISQAGYVLMGSATDTDGDGYKETVGISTATSISGGGVVPTSSPAPKSDGYGKAFGYCAFDNGSVRNAANHIAGSSTPNTANIVFAVVSAGPDATFQTSCADIYGGVTKGDDVVFAVSEAQVSLGTAATTSMYWGTPVANSTALNNLTTSALNDGEIRLKKDDGTLWRWDISTTSWKPVGGGWILNGGAMSYTGGNVLIGTTTDNGVDKLQVAGSASFTGAVTAGSYKVGGLTVIDGSGNWVGNTIPVSKGGTGLTTLGSSGQLLGVNIAGTGMTYRSLQGTANQITVTIANDSTITLTLPQDIATTSSPTFNNLTLNGNLGVSGTITLNGQLNANGGIATTTITASGLITGQRFQANGGTVTANYPLFNGTQTWNNAGVAFNGIFLNITDTASLSTSNLMDLQVASSSKFAVRKDGSVYINGTGIVDSSRNATFSNLNVTSSTAPTNGVYLAATNTLGLSANGAAIAKLDSSGVNITTGGLKVNGTQIISSGGTFDVSTGGVKKGANNVIDTSGFVYANAPGAITAGNTCTQVGAVGTDSSGDLYICK